MQALSIAWDSRPKAQGGQRWFHLYPGPEHQGRRLRCTGPAAARTGTSQCAECHSTNLRKNFDAKTGDVQDDVVGAQRLVRGLPRPRLEPRRVGEEAGRLAGARRDQGPRAGARRAQGRDLDAGRRDRQRAAQRAAHDGARDRHVRALPRPRRAASPTTTCTASRRSTRTGSRCSTTTSTGTTARCATRSTTGARSCRAGCTRRASPARTATIRIRSSCARRATPCARNATSRRSTTPRRTRITPQGTPGAACAACHMPTTTYMVVDPRHDHSLRIPRPDLSVKLGMPERLQQLPRARRRRNGRPTRSRNGPGKPPVELPEFRRGAARGLGRARRARAARCSRSSTTRRSRRSSAPARSQRLGHWLTPATHRCAWRAR